MQKNVTAALLAIVGALLLSPQGHAAVVLVGTAYSQNFDEPILSSSAVTGQWTGTTQNAVPGTSGWVGTRLGGTGSAMNYSVNDGASNAGAIYSYGTSGSTERALGAIASGTNIGAFGVEIVNGNSLAIDQVTIQYMGEFWRSSTSTQNVLTFGYSVGASGSTGFLSSGGSTAVAALDLVGPAPVAVNGLLNGNLAPNRAAFSAVIDVDIPAGESLYLRWQDFNDLGNDAGLAIDDFSLSANLVVPEPASMVLAGLGLSGLALAARRRLCRRSSR
jgi:hypothetical protein